MNGFKNIIVIFEITMGDNKSVSPCFNYKSTPPQNNRKIRNPFDKALIDRLHKPICSPGMCKIYKKKKTGTFRWDIDQACTLVPADIVACNSQFEPSPDPALERIAEEATEKFFSQEMVMPSPLLETSKKLKPLLQTSSDTSVVLNSFVKEESTVITRDVSAQTVLTLPPELPPELEKIFQPFFTFTQDQDISGEYEITVNGSLRRKLYFEEHSDIEHDDSEQTDDEIHTELRPSSRFDAHTPIIFSPDLTRDCVGKGMKRTFGTPLKTCPTANKPSYRNKILDVVDFGEACPFSPIEFTTPKRQEQESATSSLASASISPVAKAVSSDEEKNNFTSPELETMAKCLNCVASDSDEKKRPCFCKISPNKIALTRSKSLKDSPPRSRKGSISEKRSLSMSSLHRSRSVQKLDFSMDMSIDGSLHDTSHADSEYSSAQEKEATWSIVEEANIRQLAEADSAKTQAKRIQSSNLQSVTILDETPIRIKSKSNARSHEISKIRDAMPPSPLEMSFDSSSDNFDNQLGSEDKNIDFNEIDFKFLTENVSQFDYTVGNTTKVGDEITSSFKRVDSGFAENTFYANASSYYGCAIKPSELTITNMSSSKSVLKEISNVNWTRVDSGFKDENSADSIHFNNLCESQMKKYPSYFPEEKLENKENAEDFDKFFDRSSNKHERMSMSEISTDGSTFYCNFSSTPSKNKSQKVNS